MKSTLAVLGAVLLVGPTGCSKKSASTDKKQRTESRQAPKSRKSHCRPFCKRLNECAQQISSALVSDLPKKPRKLFKGKLMARYKNIPQCILDCERAEKANPGPKSALAMCKDSPDCQALAECLHKIVLERRKKLSSAQEEHKLKVQGARKAAKIEQQTQARNGGLKPGGPQDVGKKASMKQAIPHPRSRAK